MEFNTNQSEITILRDGNDIKLVFTDLENLQINLSDSGVEDVKLLFDRVFDSIITTNSLISFCLNDEKNDLFHEVAEDIILQLNSEITQSEDKLKKIIELEKEKS